MSLRSAHSVLCPPRIVVGMNAEQKGFFGLVPHVLWVYSFVIARWCLFLDTSIPLLNIVLFYYFIYYWVSMRLEERRTAASKLYRDEYCFSSRKTDSNWYRSLLEYSIWSMHTPLGVCCFASELVICTSFVTVFVSVSVDSWECAHLCDEESQCGRTGRQPQDKGSQRSVLLWY